MTANTAQAQAWNGDDGRHFAAEHARHERMQQRLTARLLDAAAISDADTVLDIGCGCGQTTLLAARAASRGQALGVDLSAPMRAVARRLAGRDGVRNVRFELADAQTSTFPAADRRGMTVGIMISRVSSPALSSCLRLCRSIPIPGGSGSAGSLQAA